MKSLHSFWGFKSLWKSIRKQPVAGIPRNGLIAEFLLAWNPNDTSLLANNGVASGMTYWADYAIFDADTDWIEIASNAAYNTDTGTIAVKVKTSAVWLIYVATRSDNTLDDRYLSVWPVTAWVVWFYDWGWEESTGTVNNDARHTILIDYVPWTVKIYIDNVLDSTHSKNFNTGADWSVLTIWNRILDVKNFAWNIAKFRRWNRQLTASEKVLVSTEANPA